MYQICIVGFLLFIGATMLITTESQIKKYSEELYRVYSREPLSDGVECYSSSRGLSESDKVYVSSVKACHIKHSNGKFTFTNEDLSSTIDWFPAQVINIGNTFKKCKKVKKSVGKVIDGQGCLLDVSGLPAFNEEVKTHEYRFYLTLFNEYTIKDCQYDRHNLYDAKINSSKYDLESKLQNSEFLKSKDFKVINVKREEHETIPVGIIVKELEPTDNSLEYGQVLIDMSNRITINWH